MKPDHTSATDAVFAGLSTEVTLPEFPCPKCSKAMKDNNTREMLVEGKNMRICSDPACRAQADWSTGAGILTDN